MTAPGKVMRFRRVAVLFSSQFKVFLKIYIAVAVFALLAVLLSRQDFQLDMEPGVLYAGVAGSPYSERICVSDSGISVASFKVKQGALPEGFQLKHVRGRQCASLEGTTIRPGRYYFTIQTKEAAIPGRWGSVSYLLQIAQPESPPPRPPIP